MMWEIIPHPWGKGEFLIWYEEQSIEISQLVGVEVYMCPIVVLDSPVPSC